MIQHTFFYVDLSAHGSRVGYSAPRIGKGWEDSGDKIVSTHITSFRRHSPEDSICMLTDDATPAQGVATFRVPPRPGEGILALRIRAIIEFGKRYGTPFFHSDADLAFFGPISKLVPIDAVDAASGVRDSVCFAPTQTLLEGAKFPDEWLHPDRKDYVRLDRIFPYLTGFFYVGSKRYLEELEAAAEKHVYPYPDLCLWWGDMVAHNEACDNVPTHKVYPIAVVGSGRYPTQLVVFQKGKKLANTIAAFADAAEVGVPAQTSHHLGSTATNWPTMRPVEDTDDRT